MLQHDEPDDFVIATGAIAQRSRIPGAGVRAGRARLAEFVEPDPRQIRPADVALLLGDSTKAKRAFGWEPKVTFDRLVDLMVDADLALAKREAAAGAPPAP